MSQLTFLTDNLILNSQSEFSLISGSENPNFPMSNIKKNFTTKVFRNNESSFELLIDLKTITEINTFSIVGHSLEGLGVTSLSLSLSATNDFTGVTPIEIDLNHTNNFGFSRMGTSYARYAKLTGSNTGLFCELSNVFLGKAIDLEFNGLAQDSFTFGIIDNSSRSSNEYGQDFINLRNQMKTLSGNVNFANKEEVDKLDYLIRKHSSGSPFWILLDHDFDTITDASFRLSGYYKLQSVPIFQSSGAFLFSVEFKFLEVV